MFSRHFLLAACCLWLVTGHLYAADAPDGTWKWTNDMGDRTREFDVTGLKFVDGKLSFDFKNQHDGLDVNLKWNCSRSEKEDAMRGTLTYDADGNVGDIEMSGKRKK